MGSLVNGKLIDAGRLVIDYNLVTTLANYIHGTAVGYGGKVWAEDLYESIVPSGSIFYQGIAHKADGTMYVTSAEITTLKFVDGLPVRYDGALYIDESDTDATSYVNGLPIAGNRVLVNDFWLSLFANGESGGLYLPEQQYLYTDAGSTLVTDYGDLVYQMNDASGNGFNAVQATEAARPRWARMPVVGVRNLLTYTEQLDNAAWLKNNASVTANAAEAPDGSTTADKIVEDSSTDFHTIEQQDSYTAGASTTYRLSAYMKSAGDARFGILRSNQSGANNWVVVNLSTGAITESGPGQANETISDEGNGWYRVSFTFSDTSTVGAVLAVSNSATPGTGAPSYAGDGSSGFYAWGLQLEIGTTLSEYQKVTNQYNVTQSGVRSINYLACDGIDDYLTIPGSDSAFKFMHDGTGGTFAGAFSWDQLVDDGASYSLFGSIVFATTEIGARAYLTDASTNSARAQLRITGGDASDAVINVASDNDTVPRGEPFVFRSDYSSPDANFVLLPSVSEGASQVASPSSADADNDMRLFSRGDDGNNYNGKFFGGLFINKIFTATEQANVDRALAYRSGAVIS